MSQNYDQLLQTLPARLTTIVAALRQAGPGKTIGIIVPDITDYVDVYITQLRRRCPEAQIVKRTTGPFEKTTILEIRLSTIIQAELN